MKKSPLVRKTPMRKKKPVKSRPAIVRAESQGKTLTRSQIMKLCDMEWAKAVKLRAEYRCELCAFLASDKPAVDSHHMILRRHQASRWNISNGVALCQGCHLNYHNGEPHTAWEYLKKVRPKDYDIVIALKNVTVKNGTLEMREILAYLRGVVAEFSPLD